MGFSIYRFLFIISRKHRENAKPRMLSSNRYSAIGASRKYCEVGANGADDIIAKRLARGAKRQR